MIKKIIYLFLSLMLFTACSSNNNSTTNINKPITNEQANLLSRVLYRNHKHGGADFIAVSGNLPQGFVASGEISWQDSPIVYIAVSLQQLGQRDIDAFITTQGVYESLLTVSQNDQISFDVTKRVLRPFDPTRYGIDALGQFLIKLAAQTPDNPILLKQNGARYLGDEKVDSTITSRYKISDSVTYYVTKSGDLKRVVANVKGFQYPIVITLSNFSMRNIDLPPNDSVLKFEDIREEYLAHRPSF